MSADKIYNDAIIIPSEQSEDVIKYLTSIGVQPNIMTSDEYNQLHALEIDQEQQKITRQVAKKQKSKKMRRKIAKRTAQTGYIVATPVVVIADGALLVASVPLLMVFGLGILTGTAAVGIGYGWVKLGGELF